MATNTVYTKGYVNYFKNYNEYDFIPGMIVKHKGALDTPLVVALITYGDITSGPGASYRVVFCRYFNERTEEFQLLKFAPEELIYWDDEEEKR